MNQKHANTETKGGRWLRVSLLTLAGLTPLISTIANYFNKRSKLMGQLSEFEESRQNEAPVKTTQPALSTAQQRMDNIMLATRQRTAEQAQQLQKLAQHWQDQALELRKALSNESRQRRKLNKTFKQVSETGRDWSQELLKRGEGAAANVATQSGKFTHDLLERSGKVTHDITKRGSQVTHAVAERGDQLRRSGTFWMIFGFSLGMVAAATITVVLLRKRVVKQRARSAGAEHIELPQDRSWQGASNREQGKSAGEILHLSKDESSVATLQSVDVDSAQAVEAPTDAAFVGVISTKHYYPIETSLDENTKDIVLFVSEDEAKAQGYSAAE